MSQVLPSGAQFDIHFADQYATIVEVGGGLRRLGCQGRELLDGYEDVERCTGARGLPLVPWPNRIANGRYNFGGNDYQLPLTEPDKHNAIHGLLRWRNWTCRAHTDDRVVMGITLRPMMGYPFSLDVAVEYQLSETGLAVTTTARNIGSQACPYAAGQHPYISSGSGPVDQCRLQLDADRWMPTDERGIPVDVVPVAGSDVDFRAGRAIGEQDIDCTFTGLARDVDGLAWVSVSSSGIGRTSVWVDRGYPYVEIYTSHTQAGRHWRRGLGVEPMTCPPNAFASGIDVVTLEPGHATTARWGMRAE